MQETIEISQRRLLAKARQETGIPSIQKSRRKRASTRFRRFSLSRQTIVSIGGRNPSEARAGSLKKLQSEPRYESGYPVISHVMKMSEKL